jgi:hypothetical protein
MSAKIVWLASYPKSGNTWLRIFLTNLIHGSITPIDLNDLITNGSSFSRPMIDDVLGFDTGDLTPDECARLRPVVFRWISDQLTDPVYYKTHDACTQLGNGDWAMAPEATDKVVYILRNPLDVVVSWAHHSGVSLDASIKGLGRTQNVLAKQKPTGQQQQLEQPVGTWSQHVESWTENSLFNTCVVRYEDMRATPEQTFAKIAAFLGLPHDTAQINQAVRNTAFEGLQEQEITTGFRERPQKVDRFFRKGIVGDWQETLSPEQIEKVVDDHGPVMQQFGYLNTDGTPRLS